MSSGGQLLVRTLHDLGVERVFCVAGESYLPVLDAFLEVKGVGQKKYEQYGEIFITAIKAHCTEHSLDMNSEVY